MKFCCGLFETLDLAWSSQSRLASSGQRAEFVFTVLRLKLRGQFSKPYQYCFIVLNFCKAAAEVVILIHTDLLDQDCTPFLTKFAHFWSLSIKLYDYQAHLQFFLLN